MTREARYLEEKALQTAESEERLEELKEAAMRVLPAYEPEMVRRERVFCSMQGIIASNWTGWRLVANRDKDGRLVGGCGIQSVSFFFRHKLAGFRLVDVTDSAERLLYDIAGAFHAAQERIQGLSKQEETC